MELRDINKWSAQLPADWEIEFNELYEFEPATVELISGQRDKQLIWEQYFGQDLLQIRNAQRALLLDVGWYPHADKHGAYFLKLLPIVERAPLWDAPQHVFETRQFVSLVKEIDQIVNPTQVKL